MQESTDSRNAILEKLIEPNDDVEPISRILSYCYEIQSGYEDYIQELLNRDLTITWSMPPYQTISRSVVKAQTMEQLSAFADDLRFDRITNDESELILKNWNQFCKKYKLPNKPECFAQWKNRNKKFRSGRTPEETLRYTITAYLARKLNRTLHQVYMHFVSKYGYKAYGAYSPVEEKLMEICFSYDPSQAVVTLQTILQREPRALYKRMKIYFNGQVDEKAHKVKWNIKLVEKFVRNLLKLCSCNDISELRDKHIQKVIWVSLSKVLDIPYVRLRDVWLRKLHVQFFSKKPVYLKLVRLKVINILRNSSFKYWREIDWNYVRSQFPKGYTTTFLYYYTVMIVFKCVRRFTKVPLTKVLDEVENRSRSLKFRSKCLKRLTYNTDGTLELVNLAIKSPQEQ